MEGQEKLGENKWPLKVFVTDPGLAAVLAEVDLCKRLCKTLPLPEMTGNLLQSVLGDMLTEEGGLNKLW